MTILAILAIIAAVVGIIGSIVPGLPGPPISWIGMLVTFLGHFTDKAGDPMSAKFLIIWFVIMVVVSVLDYVVPAWFTRVTGGHKAASTGAILGLFAGMFLAPIGVIFGSLAGAFLGELMVTDKGAWAAFKASIGAFMGFICGTGLKLIASGLMFYYICVYVF